MISCGTPDFPDDYKELKLLAKSNDRLKSILNALEQTLDLYKIKSKRLLMANTILRFSNIKSNMVPADDESRRLFKMTETFLSKCEK